MATNSKNKNNDPAYRAFRLLQVVFIAAPILAGIDKFFYFLTDWSLYLAPWSIQMINGYVTSFMMVVGIVEIIVGIGMIFKPQVFSYVVALWLLCIVVNLISTGQYLDIALRDVALMLSAFALAKLSQEYSK
jgi:hypothetical protein